MRAGWHFTRSVLGRCIDVSYWGSLIPRSIYPFTLSSPLVSRASPLRSIVPFHPCIEYLCSRFYERHSPIRHHICSQIREHGRLTQYLTHFTGFRRLKPPPCVLRNSWFFLLGILILQWCKGWYGLRRMLLGSSIKAFRSSHGYFECIGIQASGWVGPCWMESRALYLSDLSMG